MTIDISADVLSAWYQARSGASASGSGTSGTTAAPPANPSPPWSRTAAAPQASALAKAVMGGARFIDPTSAKLDAPAPKQAGDYKSLFALYQGLNALEGLTEQASAKTVGPTELARIQGRFQAGMQEVSQYLESSPFKAFDVAQGTVSSRAQGHGGIKVETDTYQTRNLYSGDSAAEVPAFQGAVTFNLTATKTGGAQVPVAFDLAEMGSTPRTMANVVLYLNGKLSAAGLTTRFAVSHTPGVAQTIQTGKTTMKLPAGPDQYGLKINGTVTETLSFSAPTSTPAVYVAQASGPQPTSTTASGAAAPAPASTPPTEQLVKLNADPANPATTPVFKTALGAAAASARATATAPDGSVYVLTDITGATADGQTIQGVRDVALNKYDSAGNLVYSRTLGAAASASGYALAVSADGSKVAVAGSVTGALDNGTTGADPAGADSFVTTYNAAGEEQWTQRRGASADDQPSGVAFGADGSVYVSGTAQSAMPGATAVGGGDGYLEGFTASGTPSFTTQFGTTGSDKTSGLAISGSSIIVAGVEGGDAVVRRFDLQPGGAPTLGLTRDLGALQGGEVAGVAVASDGSVIVAGSTHNGALAAGTVTQAYDGARDGFVARLGADLQPASTDTLTYIGGGQDRTVTGLATSGGQVYLTGQVATTPPPGQTTASDGYALALDPATGAVGWSQTLKGASATDAPASISVAAGGSSVLDQLGLPSGTIAYGQSQTLVGSTSVRAGDEFFVSGGQGKLAKAVTIEADDTLDTLAVKIARASGFSATVQPTVVNGVRTLKITPVNSRAEVELSAGPAGRDALAALGLPEGLVETPTTAKPKVGDPMADGKTYGLGLSSGLHLGDATSIQQARSALINAALQVRSIYREMTTAVIKPSPAGATGSAAVPKYLTAEIANYQAALTRLTA